MNEELFDILGSNNSAPISLTAKLHTTQTYYLIIVMKACAEPFTLFRSEYREVVHIECHKVYRLPQILN